MAFELERIASALDENYTSGFEMETIAAATVNNKKKVLTGFSEEYPVLLRLEGTPEEILEQVEVGTIQPPGGGYYGCLVLYDGGDDDSLAYVSSSTPGADGNIECHAAAEVTGAESNYTYASVTLSTSGRWAWIQEEDNYVLTSNLNTLFLANRNDENFGLPGFGIRLYKPDYGNKICLVQSVWHGETEEEAITKFKQEFVNCHVTRLLLSIIKRA